MVSVMEMLRPSAWWLVVGPLIIGLPVFMLREVKVQAALSIGACAWLMLGSWFVIPHGFSPAIGRWVLYFDRSAMYLVTLFALTNLCLIWLAMTVAGARYAFDWALVILAIDIFVIVHDGLETDLFALTIGALLTPLLIQNARIGSTSASLRFVVVTVLALPLLLLADQLLNQVQTNAGSLPNATQIILLLAGGFGLLLGIVPFQSWVSSLAVEAPPVITAFILIIFPTVAAVLLYRFAVARPEVTNVMLFQQIFFVMGCITIIVGGLMVGVQQSRQTLLGYSAIFDMGYMLIGLSVVTNVGLALLLLLLTVRAISLILITASLLSLQAWRASPAMQNQGPVDFQPVIIPVLGLAIGGITMAGSPFTIGFVARWWLLQSGPMLTPLTSLALIIGTAVFVLGYVRLIIGLFPSGEIGYLPQSLADWYRILNPLPPGYASGIRFSGAYGGQAYTLGLPLLILGLIILCLGLGLFPQSFLNLLETISQEV